jgi:beta-lactamase class A
VLALAPHADAQPAALAARVALRPPAIVTPAPREVSFGKVSGRVFAGTTRVRVFVDGAFKLSTSVDSPGKFSFVLDLPPRDVRLRVVAENASGERAGTTVSPVYGLPRLSRPLRSPPSAEDSKLAARVRALVRGFPGTAAVYVQDLSTGQGAAWNARARFPAASTLKLAIAIEVLRTLGGPPAAGSTLDQLLWSMLVYSDNEAANSLLVWLGGSTSNGGQRVNALMNRLGITDSLMYGGYEVEPTDSRPIPIQVNEQPDFGVGKYTTAWDLARLFADVHLAASSHGPLPRAGGSFGRADARYLLWLLAHVADPGKLDRLLPPSTSVLHKAGWLATARHDTGLVYWAHGAFVAAVMTWNASGVGSSSDVLAGQVARAAFDRFRALDDVRSPRPASGAFVQPAAQRPNREMRRPS